MSTNVRERARRAVKGIPTICMVIPTSVHDEVVSMMPLVGLRSTIRVE